MSVEKSIQRKILNYLNQEMKDSIRNIGKYFLYILELYTSNLFLFLNFFKRGLYKQST